MIHSNTLEAYHFGQVVFGLKQKQVLQIIDRLGQATDREIAAEFGKDTPYGIQPRISDLIRLGVLEECGSRKDPVSGKRVRVTRRVIPQGTQLCFLS